MPERPSADPDRFMEAIMWFRSRLPMTDAEFNALVDASHRRAFTIAGVAQLDVVTDVWEAIDKALVDGESFGQFTKRVEDHLTAAWGREKPWHVELVFRNGVQTSYGRGRWHQQHHPTVLESRPFLEFNAILDGRTSPACQEAHGTVLPASDPWWATHNPPMHHNCRSTTISLTEAQAKAKGFTPTPPSAAPQQGFGEAPGDDEWSPDWSRHPAQLASEARMKIAAGDY